MLKIKKTVKGYEVTFMLQGYWTIKVKEEEDLIDVIAHYYGLEIHNAATCPICNERKW